MSIRMVSNVDNANSLAFRAKFKSPQKITKKMIPSDQNSDIGHFVADMIIPAAAWCILTAGFIAGGVMAVVENCFKSDKTHVKNEQSVVKPDATKGDTIKVDTLDYKI